MKTFRFRSLAMRIWATFTVIILIIVCSISFLYLFAYRTISENARLQDLKVAHGILLKNSDFNQADMFKELRNLKGSGQFVVTASGDKRQIKDFGKPPGTLREMPSAPGEAPGYDKRASESWMASFAQGDGVYEKVCKESFNGRRFIFIISSIEAEGRENAYLLSYMPDMEDNRLLCVVTGLGLVFIIIGFITAKIAAGNISRPLKELEDYTVRIAGKDWKEPIDIKSQDEIGRLADSMNRMQKKLKHADEEEKMFLQSISHDLKTPVMVIMSHAAAIMDGVYVDSVENTARIIKEEAASLEKKIKQMLYLNTLEYVMSNGERESVDLHQLLLGIINRFEMIRSEIEWALDIDKITVTCNAGKMQVAIENILDNALRYAESIIRITLKKENSKAVLEIYNDGPLIEKNNLGRIFENLFKDKSGNFGLGLAISQKIVSFYKGEIEAVNREKGVSFLIKYPL